MQYKEKLDPEWSTSLDLMGRNINEILNIEKKTLADANSVAELYQAGLAILRFREFNLSRISEAANAIRAYFLAKYKNEKDKHHDKIASDLNHCEGNLETVTAYILSSPSFRH